MGRIPLDPAPWGGAAELESRLVQSSLPQELWLADTGALTISQQFALQSFQEQVKRAGFTCHDRSEDLTHARLLQCKSSSQPVK